MWYENIYNSTDGSHRFCLLPTSIIEGNASFAVRVNANKDVIFFFHRQVYRTLEFKLSGILAVGHLQATVSGRKMYFWPQAHPLNLWLPSQPNQPLALNRYSPFLASCPPPCLGPLPLHMTLHSFNSVHVVHAFIHPTSIHYLGGFYETGRVSSLK